MKYNEKELASLIIKEITDNDEKYFRIDILEDGYNIISRSIYDDEKAQQILKLITED